MAKAHKRASNILSYISVLVAILGQLELSLGDPRAQIVEFTCGNQLQHNTTYFVPNFIGMMEDISDQMRTKGFGISIKGSGLDTIFALAQCYGDLSVPDCVLCYAEERTVVPQCFPYNGGRIFLDGCFMRVENYNFFQEYIGGSLVDRAICGNGTKKDSSFEESARRAVLKVALDAPNNDGYSHAEVPVFGKTDQSVYVLAECWKTLSANSCKSCLENASESVFGCFPSSEGRALNTGCFMRYSDINFLNPMPRSESSKGSIVIIVTAAISTAILSVAAGIVVFYFLKKRRIQKKRKGSKDMEKLVETLRNSSLNFKYSILEKATGSFSEDNKLGQGGYGAVYKGVLADGREIAVKRLYINKHKTTDFYNEVNIISGLENKNLVRLLGCSCSGSESILVYEFLPNKSLDHFIFDPNKGKTLNWEKRYQIITGTAEGLVYLHGNTQIRIIHRDIKSSNILLDSRFRPKIADFGLARSLQGDETHLSTAIAGTLGYMAPEYLALGQLTDKADVYSFGVLILEIVTGRQNNRSKTTEYTDCLVTIVWKHFARRTVKELFDPNFMLHKHPSNNNKVDEEVERVVHIGLLCTQEQPFLRPSMAIVVKMLVQKDDQLPYPTNPPFIDENTMELNDSLHNTLLQTLGNGQTFSNISQSPIHPR